MVLYFLYFRCYVDVLVGGGGGEYQDCLCTIWFFLVAPFGSCSSDVWGWLFCLLILGFPGAASVLTTVRAVLLWLSAPCLKLHVVHSCCLSNRTWLHVGEAQLPSGWLVSSMEPSDGSAVFPRFPGFASTCLAVSLNNPNVCF